MKDCKDCRFYRQSAFGDSVSTCKYPNHILFAANNRRFHCGPEAKWFEPVSPTPRFQWLRKLFAKPPEPVPEFDFNQKSPEMYTWK